MADGVRSADVPTRLEAVTEGIVEAGWLVALVTVPLFFNVYSSQSFEPDSVALLQVLAVVIATAWLVKVAAGGRAWRPAAGDGAAGGALPVVVPVALVAAATALGTALSVDPRISVWGSYARGQGVLALAAYLVVFLAAAAHLRTACQWRRAAGAVVAAGFAVSLYALVQQLGIDPVPWDAARRRVGSSLGNPIFLGAWLVTTVFVTLHELTARVGRLVVPSAGHGVEPPPRGPLTLQAGVLLYALAFQLLALVLSQSRGPLLGILAGGYVYALIALLIARRNVAGAPRMSSWLRATLRWGWLAVIVAGIGGVVFLVVFNLPGSPLAPLRDVPWVGRLGTAFDLSSRTARVRLLTWQGCVDLLASDEPVRPPHGVPDRFDGWRPAVGYGPETLALVLGPHQPPELERLERRRAVPDRAHNETFELLVTTGGVGWVAWMALYCGTFFAAVRWLGLCGSRRAAVGFWCAVLGGGAIGAAVPVAVRGSPVLSGVGLAAGLVVGLLAYLTVAALRSRGGVAGFGAREGIVLAVLATVVGHFVEVHFGIAITASRLQLWFLLAVLVAAGSGWMSARAEAPAVEARRGDRRPARAPGSRAAWASGAAAGLVAASAAVVVVFDLMGNWTRSPRVGPILTALVVRDGAITGTTWILVFTVAVAAVVLIDPRTAADVRGRRGFLAGFAVPATAVPLCFAAVHAARLAATSRERGGRAGVLGLSEHVASHAAVAAWLVVTIALVAGVAIAAADVRDTRRAAASRIRSAVAAVVGTVAAAWLGAAALRPVQADVLLKHGRQFTTAGNAAVADALLGRAAELDPHEPMHLLYRGTAAIEGFRSSLGEARRRWIVDADRSLRAARALAPLDPDHTANLARLAAIRARAEDDPARREGLLREAAREFEEALRLRPASSVLAREMAAVLVSLQRTDQAIEVLERAAERHPWDAGLALEVAAACRAAAVAAEEAGDDAAGARMLERAVGALERAVAGGTRQERAERALAALYVRLDRREAAIEAYRGLLERYGDDFEAHRTLALLRAETGDPDAARAHARRAAELAGADRRDEVEALLRAVEDRSGAGAD